MNLQTSAWIPEVFPPGPSHGYYLVHSLYCILFFTLQPVPPLCPDLLSLPLLFQFLKSILVGHITERLLKARLHLPKLSCPHTYWGPNKTKEGSGCDSSNTVPVLKSLPPPSKLVCCTSKKWSLCNGLRGVLQHSWSVRHTWVFEEAVFRSRPLTQLLTTSFSLN